MTEIDGISDIVDMDEKGREIRPEPAAGDGPTAAPAPDPPGVRKLFPDADDRELNAELAALRAERTELSVHVGHTREDQHEVVDERVDWARRRVAFLDREFAVTLDRSPTAWPPPEHAAVRMMLDPKWAKGIRAAIDAKPACLRPGESSNIRPPRPSHEEVSCYSLQELGDLLAGLAARITERETELTLRAQRRITYRARQAERALERALGGGESGG